MRIVLTTVQVPFIKGGAELMTGALQGALAEYGHDVEVVSTPFLFHSRDSIVQSIDYWKELDLHRVDAGHIDQVISLKFPTYHVRHPNKTIWLMHQHRSVYDLFDTPHGDSSMDISAADFRAKIVSTDNETLRNEKRIFTISKNVSSRLSRYNAVNSQAVYQPPILENYFRNESTLPYVFYPSRIESLKRQDLLIRSAVHLKGQCQIFIAGTGGCMEANQRLVHQLDLGGTVKFLGQINDRQLIDFYANCLAVFFGPVDEDYGFVTLEAMLSEKPVITCTDSGGPIEFILHNETGLIVEPMPGAVADAIKFLLLDIKHARDMGAHGKKHYDRLGISWHNVVEIMTQRGK